MAQKDDSDKHEQRAEPFRPGSIHTSDAEIEKAVQHLGTPDPHPHATLSVETTHMGDPSPLYVAGVRRVDEPERSPDVRPADREHGKGPGNGPDRSDGHNNKSDARSDHHQESKTQSQPSMMKTLLLSAGIALVSGVIAAMGYWHFFGSKSSDQAGSQQSGGKAQAGSGSQQSSSGKTSRRENGAPGFSPLNPNTYGAGLSAAGLLRY